VSDKWYEVTLKDILAMCGESVNSTAYAGSTLVGTEVHYTAVPDAT